MCLIVDANAAGVLLAQASAVTEWLLGEHGSPRLVASGVLRDELLRLEKVRRFLVALDRAGRLRRVDAVELRRQEQALRVPGACASNDPHVLALAIVSGARTLVTFDNALTADFKNSRIINNPRGSVYRNPATHSRLLRHTRSCGVRVFERRSG